LQTPISHWLHDKNHIIMGQASCGEYGLTFNLVPSNGIKY